MWPGTAALTEYASVIHIALHFLIPALVAGTFFRHNRKYAYLVMIATIVVDIDHVFANPIYDPQRCSVGFHPLHQLWFVAVYFVMCFIPQTRLVGLGLTLHMVLDSIDCQVTNGIWWQ